MGESLYARLWQGSRDLVRECRQHPFVRRLEDGTLDRNAFRRYVAQDAFFLRAFLEAYALGAAKSDTLPVARQFVRLMDGVLDELELHRGYAEELGIDLDAVEPYAETSAYADFLLRTAWEADLAEIVAAMTPCMRLYAYLGEELAPAAVQDNPYRDWIETYSSHEFEALAAELEALLDELATESPEVRSAYRYAMRCELDFFGAPLEPR